MVGINGELVKIAEDRIIREHHRTCRTTPGTCGFAQCPNSAEGHLKRQLARAQAEAKEREQQILQLNAQVEELQSKIRANDEALERALQQQHISAEEIRQLRQELKQLYQLLLRCQQQQ